MTGVWRAAHIMTTLKDLVDALLDFRGGHPRISLSTPSGPGWKAQAQFFTSYAAVISVVSFINTGHGLFSPVRQLFQLLEKWNFLEGHVREQGLHGSDQAKLLSQVTLLIVISPWSLVVSV
eukprot:1150109-Pelagomonas_calceolata.AAC.2